MAASWIVLLVIFNLLSSTSAGVYVSFINPLGNMTSATYDNSWGDAKTYTVRQAEVDNMNRSRILVSVGSVQGGPYEFGTLDDVDDFTQYTLIIGDVTRGSTSAGDIADGNSSTAVIKVIKQFSQNSDGTKVFFADNFCIRKLDRTAEEINTVIGDCTDDTEDLSSWAGLVLGDVTGIAYLEAKDWLFAAVPSGIIILDLANQEVGLVAHKENILQSIATDLMYEMIISPDNDTLYVKVDTGMNRYDIGGLTNVTTANLTESDNGIWISATESGTPDTGAAVTYTNFTIGSAEGGMVFFPNGDVIVMADSNEDKLFFYEVSTGELNRICQTGLSGEVDDGDADNCGYEDVDAAVLMDDYTLIVFGRYRTTLRPQTSYNVVSKMVLATPTTTTTATPTTISTATPTTTAAATQTTTATATPTITATATPTTMTTATPTTMTTATPTTPTATTQNTASSSIAGAPQTTTVAPQTTTAAPQTNVSSSSSNNSTQTDNGTANTQAPEPSSLTTTLSNATSQMSVPANDTSPPTESSTTFDVSSNISSSSAPVSQTTQSTTANMTISPRTNGVVATTPPALLPAEIAGIAVGSTLGAAGLATTVVLVALKMKAIGPFTAAAAVTPIA